jgi:hypothetical protein
VLSLIGFAARTLTEPGQRAEAKDMTSRYFAAHSYDEALAITAEYVEIQ